MAASLNYSVHQYADENELQRLGLWEVDLQDKSKYWIIYIHGGAWRDPRIGQETFTPIIDRILSPPPPPSPPPPSSSEHSRRARSPAIAAFASLDYRLSPHPEFPQDPAGTPARQLRAAKHPDHLDDARAGVAYLQRRFGFGGRYVLVGHSAGACLALQLLASPREGSAALPPPPRAIVGFEGVYDFRGLDARFGGAYAGFLGGAFGGDPRGWDAVAPMTLPGSYGERWGGSGKLAALGWSREDDWIDEQEIDGMAARLRKDGVRTTLFKDLRGGHDETWQDGTGVARMVFAVLDAIHDV